MRMGLGACLGAALLALCGCWNGKDQFRRYMEEGRANQVPIVIYDISENDPRRIYSQPVAVAFINAQDKEIESVVLTVSVCGTKASQHGSWTLDMGGPFEPDASFMIQPVSNPDATGNQYHMELPHMVITSVEVKDAGGTRAYSGKDVTRLLDRHVANYCVGDM